MSWNLDKITNAISPLGGKTFQDDKERIYTGLTVALAQAGSLYTDRYKPTKQARPLIKKLKESFYPADQIEKQVAAIEKSIDGAYWKSQRYLPRYLLVC